MCILFVSLFGNETSGKFKVIVATNRDEFFTRPSKPAHFWEDCSHILGGMDMTENKEGGTWLAVSKAGKLAVVLNLSGSEPDPRKEGRGFLVINYLKNPRSDHMETLKQSRDQYNKFHFVTIDFDGEPILKHYSNGDEPERTASLRDGIFAIGNSPLEKPYEKVKKGKARFDDIVNKYGNVKDKDRLVSELLDLLKWEERHVDPTGMEAAHIPEAFRHACSSICINIPNAKYGTRTHTIILVDSTGETDFYEWTLKEPINPTEKEWISSHYSFRAAQHV